ncbi:M20 family metallo-hydrolase [Flavilitoribacter nigricans]|uniref:Acetylornithine deacetylase n=1 Tax=Flavilitoribacter nigricans (strain ATCC 23147 / DSM 23189 / NBRC 102662 / NCIMB 1420 / SS-2) TaxID=1122177 RepID=A0A2D0NAZ9_FLAN2|nr:M20 family metallo-hydrolase [Flavilitoribacter nigricans]PHN05657.1 acetylornithine deacetylase [Flavilitoribacter nigricans DSM 23189 = NBRC 102662]
MTIDSATQSAVELLHQLIGTPSFSREEEGTAAILFAILKDRGVAVQQNGNNVWARNKHWQDGLPVILLNSHHDTVKPASGYSRDPFVPEVEDDQLFGLGSNDAGGPLVSLLFTFLHFYYRDDLPYNLILAATAEEEISGANGIASLLPELGEIQLGIVGEPTQMQMAIAEKGLMVIDGEAIGKSGHAARDEGINALYLALEDINWIRNFQFPEVSPMLGPVKATVTQIKAGTQHNVVPDRCDFVIDVRTNELYSNWDAFTILQSNTKSILKARSYRLNSSRLEEDHPIVQRGRSLGLTTFGSPTLSDQALMAFPTLKIGPGDSARSHTADEYIRISEIREGIALYIQLMEGLKIEQA